MNDGNATAGPRGPVERTVPVGDDRERLVCPDCGFIDYENPRIVVGSIVTFGDRLLMCRRAIEPRRGFWALPAGFLEIGESPEEGAMREAWEEARARIRIERLLAVYTIRRIRQVQLIYRAELVEPDVSAGPESQEVALLGWDEIPWEDIAFPSVHWALRQWRDMRGQSGFAPLVNPDGDDGDMLRRRPSG